MEVLNVNGLAMVLNVPKSTIYQWVHLGKIPYFKAGRHLRFDLEEVLEHFRQSSLDKQNRTTSRLRRFGSLTTEEKRRGNPFNKGGRHGDI